MNLFSSKQKPPQSSEASPRRSPNKLRKKTPSSRGDSQANVGEEINGPARIPGFIDPLRTSPHMSNPTYRHESTQESKGKTTSSTQPQGFSSQAPAAPSNSSALPPIPKTDMKDLQACLEKAVAKGQKSKTHDTGDTLHVKWGNPTTRG